MSARPTEMIEAWNLNQPKNEYDWTGALAGIMNTKSLLERVAGESDVIGQELTTILVQTNFFNDVQEQVFDVADTSDEVAAIEYLRNLFGEPQDGAEGALPLFIKYAGEQVGWQQAAKDDAQKALEVIREKQDQVLTALQRVVVAELAKIQAEIDARQEVIADAETAAQPHKTELAGLLDEKRRPLDFKQVALEQKKKLLNETLETITTGVQQMAQSVEYRVMPIRAAQVAPTELDPALAA